MTSSTLKSSSNGLLMMEVSLFLKENSKSTGKVCNLKVTLKLNPFQVSYLIYHVHKDWMDVKLILYFDLQEVHLSPSWNYIMKSIIMSKNIIQNSKEIKYMSTNQPLNTCPPAVTHVFPAPTHHLNQLFLVSITSSIHTGQICFCQVFFPFPCYHSPFAAGLL